VNLVISGYYGFKNLGDEAVLLSTIQALRESLPGARITVLSHDPGHTAQAYGVEAVNRWNIREVFRALRDSQMLLSGGGSLFQDVTSRRNLYYYLGIVQMARCLRVPVAVYAQGIGPLLRLSSRWITARVLNQVQLITVRDGDSERLLRDIGVNRPPIHVTADPVLGLNPEEMDLTPGLDLARRMGIQGKVLAFSVRFWPGAEALWEALAFLGDKWQKKGGQVVFIPFHFPLDVEASREVARRMTEAPVIIEEELDVFTLMGLLKTATLLMGMRLHALIFAAVMEVPFLGLAYDPKVQAFAQRAEQCCLDLKNFSPSDLVEKGEFFWACREEHRLKLKAALPALRDKARENACLVADFLQRCWKNRQE